MPKKAQTPAPLPETQPAAGGPTVVIKGETYVMTFEFAALADAETHFRRQGHNVHLMFSLPELTLDGIRDAFPCLIHASRPEMGYEDARALIDMTSVYPVATAIVQALNGSQSAA